MSTAAELIPSPMVTAPALNVISAIEGGRDGRFVKESSPELRAPPPNRRN